MGIIFVIYQLMRKIMKKNIQTHFLTAALLTLPVLGSGMLASCSTAPKQESTGQYIDSSVITAKVKSKLISDKEVNGLPITVKTYKSIVQLSGFVDNEQQAERAIDLARSVKGVTQVHNMLLIKKQ